MGRQIHFHMLARDCEAFFAAAPHFAPFVAVIRDSATARIEPIEQPCVIRTALMFWNRTVAPSVVRTHVPAGAARGSYHRFPYDAPALEFCPTGEMSDWDGRPAIAAGRLYAAAYQDNRALADWYEKLASWLRRHFQGYRIGSSTFRVGPDAWEWHRSGGLLLPMVRPLVAPTWRRLLGISTGESPVSEHDA
jgi:hypothetical protein